MCLKYMLATLIFLQSVIHLQTAHGINKFADLKKKESEINREINMQKLGEDYYDNERKKSARYVHFNAKYKTYRSNPEPVSTTYYDEAPSGNYYRFKYQPLLGNKIVAVKDVKVRRKTSKLFETNDPLRGISHDIVNENDNTLSNSLDTELKIDPTLEIPKPKIERAKDMVSSKRPNRHFSKLYKYRPDEIDIPLTELSYMLKDLSLEVNQNIDQDNKIKPNTNDILKPSDMKYLTSGIHNIVSRNRKYRNKSYSNNGYPGSNGLYRLHPEVKPAKDISFVLQENYMPEDEYKFISVNEPKGEQILNDLPRSNENLLMDDGYYVDSSVRLKKPQKHFTDLFNIETKKKENVAPLKNSTDSDIMTLKIWKALQNIKNWMNNN